MPNVPQDITDTIRELQRQVRELQAAVQTRPAMNSISGGAVTIGAGGSLNVYPPGRTPGVDPSVFSVGQWTSPEGITSYGTAARREDGSQALAVGGNLGPKQMVRLFNRSGTPVVMDDAYADNFLGRPWVPVPLTPGVNIATGVWTVTHAGLLLVQHCVLSYKVSVFAPAGSTIAAQILLQGPAGDVQIGPTMTVTGGTGGTETAFTGRVPIGTDHQHGEEWNVRVQAQRTAGTGTGTVWLYGIWSRNTLTAAEAP
ncbi:hypothetical protein AB0O31_03125 [Kitasatospora cineracea]|uniref:hypothetical protein n=1 Tax=Kitasatospora cineracea TaxID=88074 RepID=UPI0034236B7B